MAVIKQKGSKYFYIVLRKDGKQVWKSTSCTCREDALQMEIELRAIRDGKRKVEQVKRYIERMTEDAAFVSRGVSMSETWTVYLQHPDSKKMARTLAQKRQMWNNFQAWMDDRHSSLKYLQDVSREIAVEYFDYLLKEKKLSPSRHNHNKIGLRSIFKSMMFRANAQVNPFDIIPTLDKPAAVGHRAYTEDELKRILEQCDDEWKMAVRIAFCTGLRFGDVCSLRWSEVDMNNDMIPGFIPSKTQRLGKKIDIPINPVLKKHLEQMPQSNEYVLPTFNKRVKSHTFQEAFGKILEKAKVVDNDSGTATFHSLRTTYVTNLVSSGVPLETIQKLVGHGSPVITQGYNRALEPLRQAVAMLPTI